MGFNRDSYVGQEVTILSPCVVQRVYTHVLYVGYVTDSMFKIGNLGLTE